MSLEKDKMVMTKESYLVEDKIIVDDSTLKGWLVEKGFGENKTRNLVLDLYEGLFLLLNDKIEIVNRNKKIKAKELLELGLKKDKNFYSKSLVYSDIREKGYQIKTGLKFGFDFRIYPKGKKMGQTHSKYGLNVYSETEKLSMTQISRLTRLAGNIHIQTVLAIVDRENSINYYTTNRELL